MVKDPVCGMNVDEKNAEFQSQFEGKRYTFCSDECKQKFDEEPEQYAKAVA